jgi:hypothetical protein
MPAEDQIDELACPNCGDPLVEGDRFCGTCGTPSPSAPRPAAEAQPFAADGQRPAPTAQRPAPWPDTPGTSGTLNGDQDLVPAQTSLPADPSAPFFVHAAPKPPQRLGNATRYLCAAAYLDRTFANDVIWELIASRRTVVPSVNVDVGPVIRHCLKARRISLIRDVVLAVIVVLGLIINPPATINFLFLCFALGILLPLARWRRRNLLGKFVVVLVAALTVSTIGSFAFFLVVGTVFTLLASGSAVTALAGLFAIGLAFIVLLAATWITQFICQRTVYRTLGEDLRPGAPPPPAAAGPAEARVAAAEAAQWGNLTLYGGENPFIGTGEEADRDWAIAIELDRAGPPRLSATGRKKVRGYAPIDPVQLHVRIRERLLKLNDPDLPLNERILGLRVDDAVVGSGLLRWTSPLLDQSSRAPYSQASPAAIDALIRHPQAGLRYYQKVSVSDASPPVTSGGREVIDGVDQGIAVSGFVYVAVEGRMFYLQFVRTALTPVKGLYQLIDFIPIRSPARFFGLVAWQSLKSLFGAVIYSPAEIYAALRLRHRERKFEREFSPTNGSVFASFGAKMSIRERGAADSFGTHIEGLDVDKYTKIIERCLTDTVLDFLADNDVDTSAFAASASTIITGDVNNIDVSGGSNQFGGRGSSFTQTT